MVFPDLARLWRDDVRRFLNVTWRTGAVLGGVGMAVVAGSLLVAEPLLRGLAGKDFSAAAGLLSLLLLAASIELGGAAFRPASYVMGKARVLLYVQILATTIYLGSFVLLASVYGLNGIGLATILSAIVAFLGAGMLVHRGYRQRLRADRAARSSDTGGAS